MKALIFLLVAIIQSFSINQAQAESMYCEWFGNAANVIAQNRDNGMSEFDLTENYLNQNQTYQQQQIIIPLIDRVYGKEGQLSPETIAIVEQQRCELALVNYSRDNY